jgi:dTDP-glucose 4,6-dehydratase
MSKAYIVTGGAGFIGSNLVHELFQREPESRVTVLDRLTYAGNPENLASLQGNARFELVHGDICDAALVDALYARVKPDAVFNLAAESHVDRSIDGPGEFVRTNVQGTFQMLHSARAYWSGLDAAKKAAFRFLHISTDEVYGSLGDEGFFTEASQYQPNSPYAASKAAADHLARAWFHTYGLPTIVTNCSNNYGPYQFPEKLIPLVTLNALEGKKLPVYGDGKNIRDWLYVGDHCAALRLCCDKGVPGEVYCVGGHNERTTLQIVETICDVLDRLRPSKDGSYRRLITFVKDRPGHDRRYAIDPAKIGRELGWKPETMFDQGIEKTIAWYLANKAWSDRITETKYKRERLGAEVSK